VGLFEPRWAVQAREDTFTGCKIRGRLHAIMQRRTSIPKKCWQCKVHLWCPDLIKGGFVFGGKHGRRPRAVPPMARAPPHSFQWAVEVGTADGIEGVDWSCVHEHQGFQYLLSSKFQLSGEDRWLPARSVVMASAGTDWKMNTQMLTYSRSKASSPDNSRRAVVEQDNTLRKPSTQDMRFRNPFRQGSTPHADAFMQALHVRANKRGLPKQETTRVIESECWQHIVCADRNCPSSG